MDKLNVVSFKIAKVCPLSTFNSKFLFTCNFYLNRPNNYITKLKNFSHSLKAGINSGWNHVRCCLLYVISFEKTSLNVSKRRLKRLLLRCETFWIVVGIFNGRCLVTISRTQENHLKLFKTIVLLALRNVFPIFCF